MIQACLSQKLFASLAAVAVALVLFSAGCEKPASPKGSEASRSNNVQKPEVAGPGPNEKICFSCQGEGDVPCHVSGCVKGQVDCSGPCLKLTRGTWIHMNAAGHDLNDLWQRFPNQSGGGYQAWNQHHVGEVIAYQNGVAVNTGPCKICGGSAKLACVVCKGTGKQSCEICQGKKFIPSAWTITDNPWFNSQPDLIRLADGQAILGRVAAVSGDDNTIVTRDKKVLHVKSSDILSKGSLPVHAAAEAPAK